MKSHSSVDGTTAMTSIGSWLIPLAVVVLVTVTVSAQKYIKIDPKRACSYYGETPGEELAVFDADKDALEFVASVTKYTGVPQNFKVYAGNVRNALAHQADAGGERQIIYNQDFMRATVKSTGEKWAAISVMAHEIGHHISAHPLGSATKPKREQELEADKYSGYVLRRMRATLEQAKVAMERQPDLAKAGYPDKSARLAAIQNGWIEADDQAKEELTPPKQTSPQPVAEPKPESKPRPAEPEPEVPKAPKTGRVRLSYAGDLYGCSLQLRFTIGGRSVTPTSNTFSITNVPLGEQDYEVRGRIGCPGVGVCEARGTGTVDVNDGDTYQVFWSNTSYARCDVGLR